MSVLCFNIRDALYAVEVKFAKRVLFKIKVEEFRSSKPYVVGLYKINDTLYPVIDLGLLLAGESTEGDYYIIIESVGEGMIGKVDKVVGVFRLESRVIDSSVKLSSIANEYVSGVADLDGKTVFILDAKKLIASI